MYYGAEEILRHDHADVGQEHGDPRRVVEELRDHLAAERGEDEQQQVHQHKVRYDDGDPYCDISGNALTHDNSKMRK